MSLSIVVPRIRRAFDWLLAVEQRWVLSHWRRRVIRVSRRRTWVRDLPVRRGMGLYEHGGPWEEERERIERRLSKSEGWRLL
ncbi:hypothetical protein IC582_000337 [Cucumis melo]